MPSTVSRLIDRSRTAVVGCSLIVVHGSAGNAGFRTHYRPGLGWGGGVGHDLPNEAIFPRNANKLNLLVPLDTNRIAKPLPAGRSVTASPEFRMAHRGAEQAAAGVALGV
jgi:hypothetical protein